MRKLLPQEHFYLREELCAGTPVRSPEGMKGSTEGKDTTPLAIRSTIYLADIVVNGERPLICPYLRREPDADYCGAWIGVVKDETDTTGRGSRYTPIDIPICCHAYRIPSPIPT